MRVLIVDDEVLLADSVHRVLSREGLAADVAHDGEGALERLAVTDYDVLVLDRDLPGVSGDEVCRRLIDAGGGPAVLMLTASGLTDQMVEGFELGADDYLAKPFEFPELVARIRALGRRPREARPPVLSAGGITLDPFRREVFRNGRYVRLSRKEFAVLDVLLSARGGVVSAERLLEKAWDENADPFTNSVRVTVSTLRRHLGDGSVIETVPGVGYRIDPRREP